MESELSLAVIYFACLKEETKNDGNIKKKKEVMAELEKNGAIIEPHD